MVLILNMRALIDELKDLKLAIFDLDGVIYRGESLIPNADYIITELREHSIKIIYNSNNSTATRKAYVNRLKKFNIESKESDFYTSASITSAEITKLKEKANIFVIGEIGLKSELKAQGHNVMEEISDFNDIDFVIVGLDREFDYQKLATAQKCILEGNSQFYATNADSTLPVDRGLKPGAGVMVNALITCTNKEPIKIFGKPEPFGINLILNDTKIPASNACIFGDRLNTDIIAGNRAGIKSIAVLTGVTTLEMIEDLKARSNKSQTIDKNLIPDLVIKNLNEIFK
jgi:phosphoglycolate/pyridoxal phosphate phosphatase family enzyme